MKKTTKNKTKIREVDKEFYKLMGKREAIIHKLVAFELEMDEFIEKNYNKTFKKKK